MALLHYIRLYITLPWVYFTLLESTLLYHDSTPLYSTMALLHCTLLYHGSTPIYFTLHYSTMALLHFT